MFISLNRVSWGPYFHPQRELSVHGRVQTHSKQNLRVSIRRQLYGWRPSGTANVMCKVFSPPPKLGEELPSLVALQTWHAYSMKIKSRCYCFSRTSSIIFHIYSWFFIEFWRHCSCIIQRSIKNVFKKIWNKIQCRALLLGYYKQGTYRFPLFYNCIDLAVRYMMAFHIYIHHFLHILFYITLLENVCLVLYTMVS